MKTKAFALIGLLLVAVAFTSCKKKVPGGWMTCKVDGSKWWADAAILTTGIGTLDISIRATDKDANQIHLFLEGAPLLEGYIFKVGDTTGVYRSYASWVGGSTADDFYSNEMAQGSGEVEITKVNYETNMADGTFEFTANNHLGESVSITKGEFSIEME